MDITLLLYYRSMDSITRLIVQLYTVSHFGSKASKNISLISFFEKSKIVILGLSYIYICYFLCKFISKKGSE